MQAEPARAPDRAADRLAPAALAALLLAVVWVGAGPGYIPTHDGPQHVFGAHVANHLGDAERGWSDWLEAGRPLTSLGFSALFAPLDLWLPWPQALRGAVALMALAWVWACWALARALHPGRAWLGLALGGAAYSWTFYMGFFSFQIASALGLGVLAWSVSRRLEGPRELGLLSAALGVVALMHVVSAFLVGLVLAALLLLRAPSWGAAFVRTAVVAAPSAALALGLLSVGMDNLELWNDHAGSAPSWTPAPWWTLGKCFTGGPAWRAWPLTALAVAALALALVGRPGRRSPEDRALLAAGGAALAAAALTPLDLSVWDFFAPRFLPIGVSVLVLTLPVERLTRGAPIVAAASLAFAFASTGWAAAYHHELGLASRDALSGLEQPIVRRGLRLPVVLEPGIDPPGASGSARMPYALPLVNLGQLYAASQGGVTPYGFVLNPRLHHVLIRPEAAAQAPALIDRSYVSDLTKPGPAGDPAFRRALLTDVASRAVRFEDVIFYGRPAEADLLRELGFVEDWRRGGLSIARFRGCPVAVHLSPGLLDAGARSFEVGWYPSWHASGSYDADQGSASPDGSRALLLRQTCGPLWLRVLEPGPACAGSDAEGRLRVASTREHPVVVCRLPGEDWTPPPAALLQQAHRSP